MPAASSDVLSQTRALFEQWRATRSGLREKIPEPLWQAVVALRDRYPVSQLYVKLRQDGVNRGSFAGKLRLCLLLLMIWPAPVSCLSNGERHGWAVRKFPTNSGKRRSLCTVATRRPSCAASCV